MPRRLTAIVTLLLLCIFAMQGSVPSCAPAGGVGHGAHPSTPRHARDAVPVQHGGVEGAAAGQSTTVREAHLGDETGRPDASHDCPASESHDACPLMPACTAAPALPASDDAAPLLVATAARIETTSSASPAPSLAPELPPPRG